MGGCCFHWIYVVVILMPLRQVPRPNNHANISNQKQQQQPRPGIGLRRFVDATTCVLNGNICENKLRQMA